MSTTIIYYNQLSFQHLDVKLTVLVIIDSFFRNNLKIMAAFHQSFEYWQTELFTVENLYHFIESVSSRGFPDMV